MEDDIFQDLCVTKPIETYSKYSRKVNNKSDEPNISECDSLREPLTTKNAMKYLLEGKLKTSVCRYCLNVVPLLSELDQILHVAGAGTIYKVTIRDMVASFHPVQVAEDPNIPDKICNQCLNMAISAYLFTQQCERAERALRNCFDDMYNKLEKLDPLERTKKRGRQKLKPNHNILHTEHERVIDYAEPVINIVNLGAESLAQTPNIIDFECKRCWQVLPNMDSLLNHEKTHPSTMWFHCRLCGKSFPKRNQLKKHYNHVHVLGKEPKTLVVNGFKCNKCGQVSDNYKQHLQHMEKHKFKLIMEHLVEKRMDSLCMVCLDKSPELVDLDEMVSIHGGYPELTGDKTLQTLLACTLPDMTSLHNYIGTKICNKCLNHAIASYIFIHQFTYARERLDVCVSHILKSLNKIKPNGNIFIQIPENTIMPVQDDIDESLLLDTNDFIDEGKLKVDVLEDEFRMKSESEEDDDKPLVHKPVKNLIDIIRPEPIGELEDLENPAKNVTKTYINKKLMNGLQNKYTDVCSEFLTFNKQKPKKKCRYSCPFCFKHFISDYFLKRHILKHVNKRVVCTTCNLSFKSRFYLYEHVKMTHLLSVSHYFSCKICGRTFLKEGKLKSHMKNHNKITCQLCDKVYINQVLYNCHLQRHSVKLELLKRRTIQNCSFCEKECANDNQLSIHVNKVHFNIKPYSCDMCDRQFYTANNLKAHKRIHDLPSKEICVFCNKILKTRKRLVVHVRKHIGAKPFACQICGQSFYTRYKAREHMKVYHGGTFCCSICKATFITKYGLKDHVDKAHIYI